MTLLGKNAMFVVFLGLGSFDLPVKVDILCLM